MENPLNIVDGFANLALKKVGMPNEEVELMATLRKRICESDIERGNPMLVDGKCTKCGCVMEAKWRALNAKCIIGKW
jgi:hypothetical protein